MNEIIEFFKGLFRYDLWPPRWKCGYWSNFHGWIYIVSELMVWTAYFLIPLIIINYFYKKRTTIRFRRVYLLFATFILLCGSTHFIDALMFWIPMYRFNALVRLITGIVSLLTTYQLFKVLPDLFEQRTNIELEREIARRQAAEQRLEEANRGLQAFAYAASHDMKEPLRKITMFTNILYTENAEKFDQRSRLNAQKIMASATRMQQLINDILILSTISGDTEMKPVDTTTVVRRAMEDLDLNIAELKAVVQVDPLPRVKGNEAYLAQMFYNLISNAIKFNKGQPFVTVTGELQGDRTVIRVTDNGIGIEEKNLQKIFEAFQRLHDKTQYEGTGIGLSIVKKIVDVHNGTIRVTSSPGRGTTFIIELQAA